jgi:hypothetical protein
MLDRFGRSALRPGRAAPLGKRGGVKDMNGRRLIPGKPLAPSEIPDYAIDRETLSELLAPRFVRRLGELNRRVAESGETLEGNLFYWDGDKEFLGASPTANLAPARRNLWRATRFKRRMLEIGVNAGHSALLVLSANPSLVYHGVDVGAHRYTARCVDYLKAEFPGRVHYWPGDSREVIPYLAAERADLDFDVFHVDGGHTSELCAADIANCLRLARGGRGKHLLLDDIDASWIFDVYSEFVSQGYLTTETFFGDWEDANRNVLGRIL